YRGLHTRPSSLTTRPSKTTRPRPWTGSCHEPEASGQSVRFDVDELAALGSTGRELDLGVDEREQRVVSAESDAVAGMDPGAALTHDDVACLDGLAAVDLDAKVFRIGVATVAGGTYALFMCHGCFSSSGLATGDAGDLDL